MQGLDWDDLKTALALARSGGLGAAAKALGRDPTTVARRLRRVEAALGAPLFLKGPDGRWRATDLGMRAADAAEQMESAALALSEAAATDRAGPAGIVRLTAAPILTTGWLAPKVDLLAASAPGITLELIAAPESLNLTAREADLAMRFARPETGGQTILARRLGEMPYAAYAAVHVTEPETLPWLGYTPETGHRPPARWLAAQTTAPERPRPLAANDALALQAAAAAGVGRTLLPRVVGDADPSLQRLLTAAPPSRPLWLLSHAETRALPRIAAVIAWLEGLAAVSVGAPQRSGIGDAMDSRP